MRELFIGVDIGGTNVKIGVIHREGDLILQKKIPTRQTGIYTDVLDDMAKEILSLKNDFPDDKLCYVGVGIAGQVDVAEGFYYEGPNMKGWKDIAIAKELQARVHIPVIIDNDANVAPLGEALFGAGKGCNSLLAVTLGTGVGGGLVFDGEVFRGARDAAGEFGHMVIKFDGWPCACGRQGCVEAYVGTQGILRSLREKIETGRSTSLSTLPFEKIMPRDISIAADTGDSIAIEVLRETGEYLGHALADAANLLNLERVVVSGGVANAGERILGPARETAKSKALRVPGETLEVVHAALGDIAGLVGAAALALQTFDKQASQAQD